jgi:hypothetical protein
MEQPQTPVGERKSDAIRRLQVGITGLALVALLVGLSTLLTSESRQSAPGTMAGTNASGGTAAGGDPASAGAMTDLGVEPAATDAPMEPAIPPKVEATPSVGPLVPDLQPDPQLRGAPRR